MMGGAIETSLRVEAEFNSPKQDRLGFKNRVGVLHILLTLSDLNFAKWLKGSWQVTKIAGCFGMVKA